MQSPAPMTMNPRPLTWWQPFAVVLAALAVAACGEDLPQFGNPALSNAAGDGGEAGPGDGFDFGNGECDCEDGEECIDGECVSMEGGEEGNEGGVEGNEGSGEGEEGREGAEGDALKDDGGVEGDEGGAEGGEDGGTEGAEGAEECNCGPTEKCQKGECVPKGPDVEAPVCGPDGEVFKCEDNGKPRRGVCHEERARCDAADPLACCPGYKCSAAGTCTISPKCTDDGACSRAGQFCLPAAGGEDQVCQFKPCGANDACDAGLTCFGGYCTSGLACSPACDAAKGEVCAQNIGKCVAVPECEVSCQPGTVPVLACPEAIIGIICAKPECTCADLPNVPEGDSGLWNSIAVSSDGAVTAAAYNQTYGDLVYLTFDAAGALASVTFVDGVPSGGAKTGNTAGPRGGTAEPGDRVGEYAALALDSAGNPHISYYDRTNGDLKYARKDGANWVTMVVDAEGNTGLYTDLVIGSDDIPQISYFRAGGPDGNSALMYVKAGGPKPASASDWPTPLKLTQGPVPCGGTCPSGENCVDNGGVFACEKKGSGCAACGSDEVCSDGGVCKKFYDVSLTQAPAGVGSFTSMALKGENPVICFYDNSIAGDARKGNLRLAIHDGNAFATSTPLDGEDASGADTGDVGRWCSIGVAGNGEIGITYSDATRNQLKYWHGNDPASGAITVISTGKGAGQTHFVGADAALAFHSGGPVVVYQDQTSTDLMFARSTDGGATWQPEALKTEGPYGFFNDIVVKGSDAYICNVRLGYADSSTPKNEIAIIKKGL